MCSDHGSNNRVFLHGGTLKGNADSWEARPEGVLTEEGEGGALFSNKERHPET